MHNERGADNTVIMFPTEKVRATKAEIVETTVVKDPATASRGNTDWQCSNWRMVEVGSAYAATFSRLFSARACISFGISGKDGSYRGLFHEQDAGELINWLFLADRGAL